MARMVTLPALRQDLSLHSGPTELDGSPTWMLHDPAANRFYRIGWSAFEILSRWALGDPQVLLNAVASETTLRLDGQDLAAVIEFLTGHHLLDAGKPADTARLAAFARAARPSRLQWLLKNYLFFRVPLLRPEAFLQRLAPHFAWAFDKRFWLCIFGCAIGGLYLASRQWDSFVHTFSAYATFSGWFAIGLSLSLAKAIHEMGHALTAQRYGCRVPTMGVAFLVLLPVLYTDTNDAWKLAAKRQRLAIASAGMLAELALAALATLAWNFMPDGGSMGPLRAGLFLLATSTWIVTLGINASPFMRFDGYFLLSDWLDMPNLHSRAFTLARWWLRRHLFGWNAPPPEQFPAPRRRFLIAFSFVTWAYRLVVFLGIAFLVYRVSFKLLGIVLLAVELGWFIVLPIAQEIGVWWKGRDAIVWNRVTRRNALILAVVAGFLALPWRHDLRAPAVLEAAQAQGLYAPAAARVTGAAIAVGTDVQAGQILARLESPDLLHQLQQEQAREQLLQAELERQPFDPQLREEGDALRQRWVETAAAVKGLQEQAEQLVVRAPFAGRVVEADQDLVPDAWIAAREKLFEVIGPRGSKAEAFVSEDDLQQVQTGGRAVFVAEASGVGRADCRIESVDRVNLAAVDALYLASTFGGAIPVRKDKQGLLAPTEAWFRVHLADCDGEGKAPAREWRGVAHLSGRWHSIAGEYVRRWVAAIQKEIGF